MYHRNFGKCYKNIKSTSHNHCQCLLPYKLADQSTSGLGRFLECQKCNILVITQALMLCLIYTHSPLGTAHPRTLCVYRAAVCDIICLKAVVLLGGKTMDHLYGNGRKLASFLLTNPALVIEHLQY